MPIYEYVCQACKDEFEVLVREGETPVCAACGSQKLSRLLSVPAAHTASSVPSKCPLPDPGMCGGGGCGLPQCGM
jgi:putative FmdB family regulatory protein